MNDRNNSPKRDQWFWIKAIILLLFSGVIAYRLFFATIPLDSINIDFSTLLSVLLALFSIWLAALFYFKATETSNAFYDNTFKYSKEIAELLIKIESGFGERLKNLDEGYSRMENRINFPVSKEEVLKAVDELKKKEEQINKKQEEKSIFIEELLANTNLEETTKEDFLIELKKRDDDLENAYKEIDELRKKIINTEDIVNRGKIYYRVLKYIQQDVVYRLGVHDYKNVPTGEIINKWNSIRNNLPPTFVEDMFNLNLIRKDRSLSASGIKFLREITFEFFIEDEEEEEEEE